MIYSLELPAAATVIGQLYGPEHAEELGEDMLLVTLGEYGIDVRWWPSYQRGGEYAVREFEGDWNNPTGGFRTCSAPEVKAFIEREISRREAELRQDRGAARSQGVLTSPA